MNPASLSTDLHDRLHEASAEDAALMQRFQEGCNECFNLLFCRHCKLVFAIAWKILRQCPEAEDTVQEVFLTIFQQREQYDVSRGTVKTWIAQFAHFKALMRRRYLNSRHLTDLEEFTAFESATARSAGLQSVAERAALVEQCLASLKPRQRRTVELIHIDGYTFAETAVLLHESLANTRNLYYRGMTALRAQLASPISAHSEGPINSVDTALSGITEPIILRTGL